ncbi:hypothetical protein BFW01_g7727 [Lasiodiplodia theobromae]|nr:hypothetical protein BFW01_g7727 [Lasiodiplodia theobromae]
MQEVQSSKRSVVGDTRIYSLQAKTNEKLCGVIVLVHHSPYQRREAIDINRVRIDTSRLQIRQQLDDFNVALFCCPQEWSHVSPSSSVKVDSAWFKPDKRSHDSLEPTFCSTGKGCLGETRRGYVHIHSPLWVADKPPDHVAMVVNHGFLQGGTALAIGVVGIHLFQPKIHKQAHQLRVPISGCPDERRIAEFVLAVRIHSLQPQAEKKLGYLNVAILNSM